MLHGEINAETYDFNYAYICKAFAKVNFPEQLNKYKQLRNYGSVYSYSKQKVNSIKLDVFVEHEISAKPLIK